MGQSLSHHFVASWFAGLFYLPRIFVNIAMVPGLGGRARAPAADGAQAAALHHHAGRACAGLGLWLWLGWGFAGGWLHAKLAVVLLVIGYHHSCAVLLRKLADNTCHKAIAGSVSITKCRCCC
jgi:putative membrane protein